MAKKQKYKFCPNCGAKLKSTDRFCINCGYSFEKKKKKIKSLYLIILLIIIFIILWVIIRISQGLPILPEIITKLFQAKNPSP